jgi:hypothetical protein
LVQADLDAGTETATVLGQSLEEVRRTTESNVAALERVEERMALPELAHDGHLEELGETAARLLNYASSHQGFSAQRNLWFNWPVSITYEPGNVALTNVNERVVEMAYAFRAVSRIEPGARILDVGASESIIALSLASLGYEVTALDPRPYPLEHPRLRVVVGAVEDWEPDETFSAVLCISTLEHIGSGEYGQTVTANADASALDRLHALTRRDGLLVLTTPVGGSTAEGGARVYDSATLETLLANWEIEDFTLVVRQDARTWSVTGEPDPDDEAVALITARRH